MNHLKTPENGVEIKQDKNPASSEKPQKMSVSEFKTHLEQTGTHLSEQEIQAQIDLLYGLGYELYKNWRTTLSH